MYPFRVRVTSYTGNVVYRVKGCDTMVARKTTHPGPQHLLKVFYYVVTDLFRPAFNSIPDDGLVKITQTKVMNLKLGPSDDTSHDVIYTATIMTPL